MLTLNCKCNCLKFNKKKCNKNSFFIINETPYCLNHSLLLYNKYVLIIQKFYRGYRARRYLVNIFNNLPSELQEIIIYYINGNFYKKKYLDTLKTIIINKTYGLHNYRNSKKKLSIDYLYNCYKLYYKYHKIIPINYLKHAYILGDQILNFCNILLDQGQFNITYSFHIFEKISLNDLDFKKICDLIDMIYKYSNLYSFTYQIYYSNQHFFA
jgi:hypothetical protein